MNTKKNSWLPGIVLLISIYVIPLWFFQPESLADTDSPWKSIKTKRRHLDHSPFFKKLFASPQEVTRACLECHPRAAKTIMKTSHWNWESESAANRSKKRCLDAGKRKWVDTYSSAVSSGRSKCTCCHIGYGWRDHSFDFSKEENVDCLVCHDWSAAYSKAGYGAPGKGVDLLAAAGSVGYPRRDNCGTCHLFGNGGKGTKHGDLDDSLINPSESIDLHMGKHNLLCIDCHCTQNHNIAGKVYSVNLRHQDGIKCKGCHVALPHGDRRINDHLSSLACQSCHIPSYAKKTPTKLAWDKAAGIFMYGRDIVPVYYWYNLNSFPCSPYDKIIQGKPFCLDRPDGDITDSSARIWPFKVFRASQPYDKKNDNLVLPLTAEQYGSCELTVPDWDKALSLWARENAMTYSGCYGFTDTLRLRPLSHMIVSAAGALKCIDCHREKSRMNWTALGYDGDPIDMGGRVANRLIKR